MIEYSSVVDIIENNRTQNVICRPLELRPSELCSFIVALANTEGGYIFVGAEIVNNSFTLCHLQDNFNTNSLLKVIRSKRIDVEYETISILVDGKRLLVFRVEKSKTPISLNGKYYMYSNNSFYEVSDKTIYYRPTVFISYASCDEPITDILERAIVDKLGDKVLISRYTQLEYKASFKTFMNSIQDHDYVLCIVSDSYLKSRACMYEVGEIIKDHHYKDRLLFVVLSEAERKYYGDKAPETIESGIYDPLRRAEYIGYWQELYETLKKRIDELDVEAAKSLIQVLKEIGNIYRNDIGEFMEFLSDENGKSFSKLAENEFDDIIKLISINP